MCDCANHTKRQQLLRSADHHYLPCPAEEAESSKTKIHGQWEAGVIKTASTEPHSHGQGNTQRETPSQNVTDTNKGLSKFNIPLRQGAWIGGKSYKYLGKNTICYIKNLARLGLFAGMAEGRA